MTRFKGIVEIDVDLDLLQNQKQALLEAYDPGDKRDELLEGLLYFLDHIQDQVADQLQDEEAVFGPTEKEK